MKSLWVIGRIHRDRICVEEGDTRLSFDVYCQQEHEE